MRKILSGVSKSIYKTTKIALLCGVSLTCASATSAIDPSSVTDLASFLNPNTPLDNAKILNNKEKIKKMIMQDRENVETILERAYTLRRLYNEAFREEFERIKAELAKTKSTLADKEHALLDQEKTLATNKSKLQTATKSNISNKLMSAARKTKIISLTEQLQKANIAVDGLTKEKAELTSKIAGLEKSLTKSNQALAAATAGLEQKQAEYDALKNVADKLVLRIKELEANSEKNKAANTAEIKKLATQLTEQRQELDARKSELSAAITKTGQLQEQIRAKDKIIQDLEKIKAENETLKTRLDAAAKHAQKLQDEKHQLNLDLGNKGIAIESANRTLKELQDKLLKNTELATAEKEKLKKQISANEAANSTLKEEKDRLSENLAEKESELTKINKTLEGTINDSKALTQKLSDANLKLDATIKLSERLQNELLDTRDALQDTREDLDAEKSKVKKIKDADAARLAAEERRRAEESAAEEEAEKQRLAAREKSRPVRGDRRVLAQ